MPNPVVHFEIMGRPGSDLPDFYNALFDWPVDVGGPVNTYTQHAHLPPQGGGIGGGIGAHGWLGFRDGDVEVEDLEERVAQGRPLGEISFFSV